MVDINSKTPKIVFAFRVEPDDEKQWKEIYNQFLLAGGAEMVKSYREFIYMATQMGTAYIKEILNKKEEE